MPRLTHPRRANSRRARAAATCWIGAALAAAALTAGCGGSAQPTPPTGLRVGVVANSAGNAGNPGVVQDTALETGVRRLREEITWEQVEPTPGARRWRRSDRLFAAAAKRGIRLLPLLTEAPAWATPPDGGLPTASRKYAAFVRDVAERYGFDGAFWRAHPALDRRLAPHWLELWNEPYFVGRADGTIDARADAERYAALANDALAAVRGLGVRLLVAVATESDRPPSDGAWLRQLAQARPGLLHRVDGFAAHPYGIVVPDGFRPLDGLLAALHRRGLRQPVWITEVGWSTCRADLGCVSEARQAANLAVLLTALGTRYAAEVDSVFVYHLYDWNAEPIGGREGGYGLLRVGGTRKPVWWEMRRFALASRR